MIPALTTLCLILCAVAGVAITTALTSSYSAARLRAALLSANAVTDSQRQLIRRIQLQQKEQAHLAWVRQQTIARLKSDVIDALQVGGTNQCESVAPNPPPAGNCQIGSPRIDQDERRAVQTTPSTSAADCSHPSTVDYPYP